MAPSKSCTRIDTLELKSLIIKKIGHQRAQKYFDHVSKFFSFSISKSEFDKFCVKTLGRENIPLHNKLIRSIIKNACVAKVPPPKGISKVGSNLDVKALNGNRNSCLQSLYGDGFPPSPRKSRSRKFRDRPSPLGPLGKPQSIASGDQSASKVNKQSPTELNSLGSRPPVEVPSVEDGEEVEQMAGSPGVQSRSPVTAPLGVSVRFGCGARKSLLAYNNPAVTCHRSGELPDTRSLRTRLERKLEVDGMGISVDCVNLLNNGLDAYLKRLIEPCMRLGNVQRSRQSYHSSMTDFCTAMELDPRILGEDWPMQLEKISLRASEE